MLILYFQLIAWKITDFKGNCLFFKWLCTHTISHKNILSAIFHAMSWKYGFNITRGPVIWIWNQFYDISTANVTKSWLSKNGVRRLSLNYLQLFFCNYYYLQLFFTNSKIVLCYPRQKYFFKKYIINDFSMFF